MHRYFHEALTQNPLIQNRLQQRRFELVRVLETAEQVTGPTARDKRQPVPGCDGPGSVQINWPQLIDRLVRFVKAHNYDANEEACLRIFRVFHSFVLSKRSLAVRARAVCFC